MANINNIAALKLQLYNHIRSMHDEVPTYHSLTPQSSHAFFLSDT